MAGFDSYVICTSPRSGSTLLCRLLAATGAAGHPASWFHTASVADWLAQFELTFDESATPRANLQSAFNAAIAAGSAGGGPFALRLQRHSAEYFFAQLKVLQPGLDTDSQRLRATFGRTAFIYLSRRDKISQAVSLVKAEQTGLWHRAADGRELERLAPPQPPSYDSAQIAAAQRQLQSWERQWQHWFSSERIDPLRIEYETLAADTRGTLCRTLQYLQLDTRHASEVKPDVAKLSDDISRQWVQRFRREYDGGQYR